MMAYSLRGYGEMVRCPYCVVPQSRQRIQYHLVRCGRAHSEKRLETCRYDATHKICAEELEAHQAQCPSRGYCDRDSYFRAAPAPPANDRRPTTQSHHTDEESWDDCNYSTYDPQRYAMNANVLRHPTGMTPAQRRQFADSERRRLSQLRSSRTGQNDPRNSK